MAKAAVVQLSGARPNRHMHPLVRNPKQLATVLQSIETSPGIVLYTLMNHTLPSFSKPGVGAGGSLCRRLAARPSGFRAVPEMPSRAIVAGQHTLDADYFRRIEAMNFTLAHDDSQSTEDLENRTSFWSAQAARPRRQRVFILRTGDTKLPTCRSCRTPAASDSQRSQDALSLWVWSPPRSGLPKSGEPAACLEQQ